MEERFSMLKFITLHHLLLQGQGGGGGGEGEGEQGAQMQVIC